MKENTKMRNHKKGSIVVAVLVITSALALILGSILRHSVTERKINGRHELRLIAKNASEAVVEYGFAQLKYKFGKQTNFSEDALAPGSPGHLKMPASDLFGSNVDHDKSAIYGGIIPGTTTGLQEIHADNPNNEFDPLRGQKVSTRKIALYAKATVTDPRGGPDITNYVSQKLQVRDAPLFAHAIFYNLDLEVSPGPIMEIHGPVHTNGDLYLQGINGVNFYYPVSTAKDMRYGWATTHGPAKGSGFEGLQRGHVKFKNRSGSLTSMKLDSGYADSTRSDWRTFAADRWNGYLLTQDHGIETYQPVAFPDYTPDDPTTVDYDPVNTGHALIEPPLHSSHADYVEAIEEQKMSTKAGLYFIWDLDTDEVTVKNQSGTTYDIGALEGSGSDKLYRIREDVMYDHRRNADITMLEFNVGKLKQLIENPNFGEVNGHIGVYDADDLTASFDPATQWNGIVYLETKSSTDPDHLNNTGIRLWGGETDVVGQGIPSRGEDKGMTFAANNAVYIKGHFNADGVMHGTSSSSNSALVPEADEVPVAVFGDSVTILSNAWNDSVTSKKPSASSTEVAAAIVSGLIPTNANNNGRSSGGVHNFPRFLESWSGKNLYIRGSLVCLYESEIDDSEWRIDYYSPPGRKWGFSELFLNGTYPPGTPMLRTYRRVDYTNLTQAEFDHAIATLPWAGTSLAVGGEVEEEVEETETETTPDPELEEEIADTGVDPEPEVETPVETEPVDPWWWWMSLFS